MKNGKMKLLAAGLALTLLAAVGSITDTEESGHASRRNAPRDAILRASRFKRRTTYPDETDLRKLEAGDEAAVPEQERQSHQAMMQLITSGTFDEAKAQAIANQSAQTHAQLEMEHARVTSQAYQVLTPEQKTELNEIMAKHQQRMEEHMRQHQEAPEQSPNQ